MQSQALQASIKSHCIAIDTSTQIQSLTARWAGQSVCMSETSLQLAECVRQLAMPVGDLDLRLLDYIAVGTGPGVFTGVRSGLSFAQGLAMALGVPCVGINSFAAQAQRAIMQSGVSEDRVQVLIVRRIKKEMYCISLWQSQALQQEPELVLEPSIWDGTSTLTQHQIARSDRHLFCADSALNQFGEYRTLCKSALEALGWAHWDWMEPVELGADLASAVAGLAQQRWQMQADALRNLAVEQIEPEYLPGAHWKTLKEQQEATRPKLLV
ncbi:MAG: tRNA (adenosine(37)-N6)-threonylcarbamoyltransferase complex dimerization subunit type 1 TsaB [Gammaproteobacteria bacterium]